MLKVQMMEQQIGNGDSNRDSTTNNVKQQQQQHHQPESTSPKRLNGGGSGGGSGNIITKTPNSSPLHHPVPQRQMTTGSIKSASQGSSPAGYVLFFNFFLKVFFQRIN